MQKQKASSNEELDFIEDAELRKIIDDAIQYIYIIFHQAKNSDNALYKEETYRVIVLYIISIIEAILLYVLKIENKHITKIEYKFPTPFSNKFIHKDIPDSPVIIAVQKKENKDNYQIGLFELVSFMKKEKIISESFTQKILNANDIRNTFHFTKPRNKITCEIDVVEKTFDLLSEVIKKLSKATKFNK